MPGKSTPKLFSRLLSNFLYFLYSYKKSGLATLFYFDFFH
ncbi:hypothetical protein HMPREF3191_00107 [Veillonellaceae bacterium DNF00626]|nr:hypothetical protein HMPREF3191_00107 [Veillonellaceae bacterium DNF00626]